jgi:asparagine N-glycosylation enzyme membrane subunit Stt3
MMGPYGVRYSWAYWVAIVAAFAFLVVDIVDDSAIWNIVVVVCLIIAIAVRPGGLRGPRAAAPPAD